MSFNVSTAFVQQYSTNIMMLLQQQGSRLRGAVQNFSFQGKAASMAEQFGAVSPVRNQSRHSDTPLISTPQDKRWIYPNDYDWADLVDNQDRLRELSLRMALKVGTIRRRGGNWMRMARVTCCKN